MGELDDIPNPFSPDRGHMRRDVTHGTLDGWTRGCRCKPCKVEARRTANKKRAKAKQAKGLDRNDPRHGTANGYRYHGCRCDRCKAAEKERVRQSNENRKERQRGQRSEPPDA